MDCNMEEFESLTENDMSKCHMSMDSLSCNLHLVVVVVTPEVGYFIYTVRHSASNHFPWQPFFIIYCLAGQTDALSKNISARVLLPLL
jgi:hypothetical protein